MSDEREWAAVRADGRLVGWQARRNPRATREELERQTLDYMATMPAWRDHPAVASRRP